VVCWSWVRRGYTNAKWRFPIRDFAFIMPIGGSVDPAYRWLSRSQQTTGWRGWTWTDCGELGAGAFIHLRGREFSEVRQVRACANRSWSAIRSALPTVVNPRFSDEPPHDDDRVRQGDPEVYDSLFPLGAPHELLVRVLPGLVRSTSQRLVAPSGAGLPFSQRSRPQKPTLLQNPVSDVRVVDPTR